MNTTNTLIDTIRESVIGENHTIKTPFGDKPLVYADYTASGRALTFIEDYIQQQVLPFYANTHTETSYTGAQTTALREEARQEIRRAINAGEDDQIIFCGSGATAAIHKLIEILNLRLPNTLDGEYQLLNNIPEIDRPVVFIGPYEHHSNELPWRESICDVVVIPLNDEGLLDLPRLEELLQIYSDRPSKIGSFSAASNVTGIKTDVDAVTQLLNRYGAHSFWDYAAAAPYVSIDMNGRESAAKNTSKSAVFISPHKFIGGPGTPGILVVKKQLLKNRVPAVSGGGTVLYVSSDSHRYIDNPERREEGGTPAIVESIRAGLVFKLQQEVGIDEIEKRESSFIKRALTRWSQQDNIDILGNLSAPRLSIASLCIKHQGRDLHYGFVVALLNDLFGIQARGGCSCAGPYGHELLGLNTDNSNALENQLLEGQAILRPGWIRLNFNYFIGEADFEYLVRAIELVAEHGWRLLPYYNVDTNDGIYRYQKEKPNLATLLDNFSFHNLNSSSSSRNKNSNSPNPSHRKLSLSAYLAIAEKEITKESREGQTYRTELTPAAEKLRWFAIPQAV